MGRADMCFHAAFAGILVMGFVVVAPLADSLWERKNEGVRSLFPNLICMRTVDLPVGSSHAVSACKARCMLGAEAFQGHQAFHRS